MIKGITILRAARTTAEWERLTSFFMALGFEPGRGWEDDGGAGAAFLAPLGNLEIVRGRMPAGVATEDNSRFPSGMTTKNAGGFPEGMTTNAAVLVEVRHLDAVRQAALRWAESVGVDAAMIGEIAETHWRSRAFDAEPVEGERLTFWEWSDPLRGRPVAVEGDLSAEGMRFAIVVARWNAVITDRLLEGALDGLLRSGASRRHVQIVRVPGAWEVPAAARMIAEQPAGSERGVDAVIALGCLLRGETAHYEAIYTEVARGIGQSQQETGVPHAFGVLTCETLEQALNRAGIKAGNKGFEAAMAAIDMVSVRRKLSEGA